MNERLKKLRNQLGLTQQEFADRLNIKRGAIANYEVGRNEPIDAVISLICREFKVNESWLRTGKGGDENMFLEPQNNDLIAKADMLLGQKDPVFEALVESYSQLNPLNRKVLLEFSMSFLKNLERYSAESGGVTNKDMERIWKKVSGTPEEFEEKYPPVEFPDTGKEVG